MAVQYLSLDGGSSPEPAKAVDMQPPAPSATEYPQQQAMSSASGGPAPAPGAGGCGDTMAWCCPCDLLCHGGCFSLCYGVDLDCDACCDSLDCGSCDCNCAC